MKINEKLSNYMEKTDGLIPTILVKQKLFLLIMAIIIPLQMFITNKVLWAISMFTPSGWMDYKLIYGIENEVLITGFTTTIITLLMIKLKGFVSGAMQMKFNPSFGNYLSNSKNILSLYKPLYEYMNTWYKDQLSKDKAPDETLVKEVLWSYLNRNGDDFKVLFDRNETSFSNKSEMFDEIKSDIVKMYAR